MKWKFGAVALIAVLGVWAGFSAYGSPSVMRNVQVGMAIAFGSLLLFSLWLWRRAAPDSGDRMVLPGVILMAVAMLMGILPRVLWPANESLQMIASIAGALLAVTLLVLQIRRLRKLRRRAQA